MKFQPKTEEEIAEDNLWPAGDYGFEVLDEVIFGDKTIETKDTTSKSGNEMIQLVLKVYNHEGHFTTIIDYLLESMAKKLRDASIACGLLEQYEMGVLSANDFKGKSGYVTLKKGKAQNGYPAKNEIQGYVTPDPEDAGTGVYAAKVNGAKTAPIHDDSIPFDRIRTMI